MSEPTTMPEPTNATQWGVRAAGTDRIRVYINGQFFDFNPHGAADLAETIRVILGIEAERDAALGRLRGELAGMRDLFEAANELASARTDERDAERQRAEQVEDLLRIAHDTSNRSEAERARAVQRAEQAKAVIERVREMAKKAIANAEEWRREHGEYMAAEVDAEDLLAALTPASGPDGNDQEKSVPVDWEPIARQRERELKEVGEARHRAEAERNALKAAITEAVKQAHARARDLSDQMHRLNAGGHFEAARDVEAAAREAHRLADILAGLDAPETVPQAPTPAVPDRIDYDQDGELDDVVVNDCMAHLERLDTGRWFLGLYGSDGRELQIDIASKTGRAEVKAFVTHNEGIEESR